MDTSRSIFGVVVVAAQLATSAPALAQTSPIKVTAWGQHYGGKVVYRYEFQNLSARPIRRFFIGLNAPEIGEGGPELSVAPRGPGTSLWLSEQVSARPTGWGVGLVYPEGSAKFSLEWVEASYFKQMWPLSPPTENAPTPVAGDQSIVSGRSVTVSATVDAIDSAYVSGHATIDLGEHLVSVPIVKADTKAPTVKINAVRLNQNEGRGEWALFHIRTEIVDDFDPNPAVSIAPISSNQLLAGGDVTMDKNNAVAWNARFRNVPGRTYTFSVRAIDASGNEAVESFVYQVGR